MKIKSNHICTKNSEIEIGEEYQYYESLPLSIFDFKVLSLNITDEWISIAAIITKSSDKGDVGLKTELGFSTGLFAYVGMFRIYDLDTYVCGYNAPKAQEIINEKLKEVDIENGILLQNNNPGETSGIEK